MFPWLHIQFCQLCFIPDGQQKWQHRMTGVIAHQCCTHHLWYQAQEVCAPVTQGINQWGHKKPSGQPWHFTVLYTWVQLSLIQDASCDTLQFSTVKSSCHWCQLAVTLYHALNNRVQLSLKPDASCETSQCFLQLSLMVTDARCQL